MAEPVAVTFDTTGQGVSDFELDLDVGQTGGKSPESMSEAIRAAVQHLDHHFDVVGREEVEIAGFVGDFTGDTRPGLAQEILPKGAYLEPALIEAKALLRAETSEVGVERVERERKLCGFAGTQLKDARIARIAVPTVADLPGEGGVLPVGSPFGHQAVTSRLEVGEMVGLARAPKGLGIDLGELLEKTNLARRRVVAGKARLQEDLGGPLQANLENTGLLSGSDLDGSSPAQVAQTGGQILVAAAAAVEEGSRFYRAVPFDLEVIEAAVEIFDHQTAISLAASHGSPTSLVAHRNGEAGTIGHRQAGFRAQNPGLQETGPFQLKVDPGKDLLGLDLDGGCGGDPPPRVDIIEVFVDMIRSDHVDAVTDSRHVAEAVMTSGIGAHRAPRVGRSDRCELDVSLGNRGSAGFFRDPAGQGAASFQLEIDPGAQLAELEIQRLHRVQAVGDEGTIQKRINLRGHRRTFRVDPRLARADSFDSVVAVVVGNGGGGPSPIGIKNDDVCGNGSLGAFRKNPSRHGSAFFQQQVDSARGRSGDDGDGGRLVEIAAELIIERARRTEEIRVDQADSVVEVAGAHVIGASIEPGDVVSPINDGSRDQMIAEDVEDADGSILEGCAILEPKSPALNGAERNQLKVHRYRIAGHDCHWCRLSQVAQVDRAVEAGMDLWRQEAAVGVDVNEKTRRWEVEGISALEIGRGGLKIITLEGVNFDVGSGNRNGLGAKDPAPQCAGFSNQGGRGL